MNSPFPGMDPYLEPHWLDVHARLVIYACDQLQSRLPGHLRARVEERVFIDDSNELDVGGRIVHPDVQIVERRERTPAASATATAEPAAPVTLLLKNEPVTRRRRSLVR